MRNTCIFTLLVLSTMPALAQTNQADYTFMTSKFLEEAEIRRYTIREMGTWGLAESGKRRQITFLEIFSKIDSSKRGVVMRYGVTKANEVTETFYCIPTQSASDQIWTEAFKAVNNQHDEKLLKTFVWALMKYSQQD